MTNSKQDYKIHQSFSNSETTQEKKQNLAYPSFQQDDDRYYKDSDNWNFDLSTLKPFDLKSKWLGNTEDLIKKFEEKLTEVKLEKDCLKKGLKIFEENEANYNRNSLKKIHFKFDKKQIYQQFIEKSRKKIEKLHPGLLLNIGSYIQKNLFFFLAKLRRVSKVFNFIYKNQEVVSFLSEKDLGSKQNLNSMTMICDDWLKFEKTFFYYKEIKYTDQIPPNSFKNDLQKAVAFINQIHKKVFKEKNFELGYFKWINHFMKTHRIVIALSTLGLTNLIMIRKPSIVAFSNYLALNSSERKKQEITKTRYFQLVKIVKDEDYKDCLIINTKVSNYLEEQHQYDFSVFIIYSLTGKSEPEGSFLDELYSYNLLVFHKYNDQKSVFIKEVNLANRNVLDTQKGVCIRFESQNLQTCTFSMKKETGFIETKLSGSFMNCLIRNSLNQIRFSEALVYSQERFYVIVIKNLLEYEPSQVETHQIP